MSDKTLLKIFIALAWIFIFVSSGWLFRTITLDLRRLEIRCYTIESDLRKLKSTNAPPRP